MNSSCLTKTETKSPFLIGVAGGTACGKVITYYILLNYYVNGLYLYFKIIQINNPCIMLLYSPLFAKIL
jgi:hypothetical protein